MELKRLGHKTTIITILFLLIAISITIYMTMFSGGDYSLTNKKQPSTFISYISVPGDSYTEDQKIIGQPLNVYFSTHVAKIEMIGQPVTAEISMNPVQRGEWRWVSGDHLRFSPVNDWIPNTEYKVNLPKEIFTPKAKIKTRKFSFSSPKFVGQVTKEEFYEDPRNLKNKQAVAAFKFNYPINTENLKEKIAVNSAGGQNYDFTYKLDDLNKTLYVLSSPVKLKNEVDLVKISLEKIENAYTQKIIDKPLSAEIPIPSISNFFKFDSLDTSIVRNEQKNNNPEQILFLNFSTAVQASELTKNLRVYYTPEFCYKVKEKISQNNNQILGLEDFEQVEITAVSLDEKSMKNHMFKYDINQQKGCLVVKINQNLKSLEGFTLGKDYIEMTNLKPYPLEAKIAFDGSVLPLKGSQKVTFVSRGVNEIKATIARIDVANLNHLVTQTSGDFSHPYFRGYSFSENNFSHLFEKQLQINAGHPAQANYSSLDLGSYFKHQKGVFLLKIKGYADKDHYTSEDARLIVLTDLGIVVKDDVNKNHHVFISDLTKEKPVSDAKVEVLGKNGMPVLSAATNDDGYAVIPDFSEFKNDKEAVVYKVSHENDISYLPINKSDRLLDMSRFDVGGEYADSNDQTAIKGFVFDDRGVYRPGETVNFGLIVRQSDLNAPQNLPFDVEIHNPRGNLVSSAKLTSTPAGFMEYSFTLPQNAMTGNYQFNLYIHDDDDNRRYVAGKAFAVEEFMPDNLRFKMAWNTPLAHGWQTDDNLKVLTSLYNLYGNPAVGHIVKSSYSLTPSCFYFDSFKGYHFLDPLRNIDKSPRSYQNELPAAKTNDKGEAVLEIDLSQFEQGTYLMRVLAEGLELGSGRGVNSALKALVSPNKFLIGWKADDNLSYINKNAERKIQFIAINNNLQQIEKSNLYLSLSKHQYISSLMKMPDETYRYQMVPKNIVVRKNPWFIGSEGASETLKTDEPGEYVLTVEDKNGQILAKVEYNVAGSANLDYAINKNANLGLKLNQQEYRGGDEIELQITAPYTGYGLITIEQDKVYAYKWFKTETTSLTEKIKLPTEVEGNAYINVAFFRNLDSKEIYMSPLSFAAAPFSVNKNDRKMKVELNLPDTVKPGQDLVVHYKTSTPAKIIVWGVNQGILQVGDYTMPNPLDYFMKKKALQVITSQIMDLIMPDIRILKQLTSTGGDNSFEQLAEENNFNPFARKLDKPVAFWSGILDADSEGQSITYKVPETFNGEIKVMAAAVSQDRFGSTSQKVLSRGDFSLNPSGPVVVAPGDEFSIALSVGNMVENSGDNFQVRVSVDAGNGFDVTNKTEQLVTLKENGEIMVDYQFKALPKLGSQEIVFTVESLDDNHFKARMPYVISVRPENPYQSLYTMGYAQKKYKLNKIAKLYPEHRVQQVTASGSPMVLASGLISYMDTFPHYCTEQTISKIFPAMEMFFKSPEFVKDLDVYALYDDAIVKLRERQTIKGGFSTWSVMGAEENPSATIYATHFLIKAKEHGFNVPVNMLNKALSYLESLAFQNPEAVNDYIPAYAAYVLTLNGQITTSYLLHLEEYLQNIYPQQWQKSLSATLIAASYKLLQDENKAQQLIGQFANVKNQYFETAFNAYLLAQHFPKLFQKQGQKEIELLLHPFEENYFLTDAAAFSVLAMNAYDSSTIDENIKFGSLTPTYTPFPRVEIGSSAEGLTIESPKPFYYVVSERGFNMNHDIQANANGLEIFKVIYDSKGKEVTQARLGDELTIKITYRVLGQSFVNDVAMVDLLPGNVEVVKNSLDTGWSVDAAEVREDRVVAYVTATPKINEISYRVKVIARGKFVVPAIYGSALYQPDVKANSAAGELIVIE